MTQNKQEFKAEAFGAKFKDICIKFKTLLAEGNTQELTAISKKLDEDLKEYQEQGLLGVAFVGAYNAGKSTQIAALTGIRDTGKPDTPIKIGSDVTTDKTTKHDWNGIKLIDTPGLWADRKDHDEISYDAIKKADLLIFCLTYDLFDDITVENFKKLAYEQGYQWKMMLVVNKMSDEAGKETEKIANYRESLAKSLKPNDLNEFPICFIDAKQYCEGFDKKNNNLIEVSRFQTFIEKLNAFVERRGDKARFDTPVRIAQGYVEDAQLSFIRTLNFTENEAFLELFNNLSRTVEKERARLRGNVKDIALENSAKIVKQITVLSSAVGENNFTDLKENVMSDVKECYKQGEIQIKNEFDNTIESLKQELEKKFKSDLGRAIEASLQSKEISSFTPVKPKSNQLIDITKTIIESVKLMGYILKDTTVNEATKNTIKAANEEIKKAQISFFEAQKIGDIANENTTEKALNEAIQKKSETSSFWLDNSQVVGSELHQQILYFDNNILGNRFSPGEEIGIAKNIGNSTKFLNYATVVVTVIGEIISHVQEQERQKKIAQARNEISRQLNANSEDLKLQIDKQLSTFEKEFLRDVEQKIAAFKESKAKEIISSNTWLKQLAEIDQEFKSILNSISTL